MTKKTLLSTLAFALSSLLLAEETEVPSTPHDTFTDSYTTLQDVLMPKTQTWKRSDIASVPKFGGYIIGSYKYGDHDANHGDGFNLRLILFVNLKASLGDAVPQKRNGHRPGIPVVLCLFRQ